MALELNKAAPAFTLPSQDGEPVSLKQFKGKPVVLFFYPKDSTPTCTKEACEFRDAYRLFLQQEAVVLGISPDSPESHRKFIGEQELPYILLSDEDKKVCEKYEVWQQKQLYGRTYMGVERSTFLIDAKGKLVGEWRKVKVKGHVENVLKALEQLKAGKKPKVEGDKAGKRRQKDEG